MADGLISWSGAPFLDRLNAAAWAKFAMDYEAYRARAGEVGRKSPKELVSAAVLRLVALRLRLSVVEVGELSDDDFIRRMSAAFAPATPLESYDKFRAISMSARSANVEAVLNYVLQYEKQALLSNETMPGDKKLKKLFVKGLRPARLSERVEFSNPESLESAKRLAVDEVEMMIKMTKEVAISEGPSSSALVSRAPAQRNANVSAPRARVGPSAVQKPPGVGVVCYACGAVGHKRGSPDCPDTRSASRPGPGDSTYRGGQRGSSAAADTSSWRSRDQHGPVPSQGQWVRSGRDTGGRLVSSQSAAAPKPESAVAPAGAPGRLNTLLNHGQQEDAVPRLAVSLHGSSVAQEVQATALVDTGASGSFVAPEVYDRLLKVGVPVRKCDRRYQAAGGRELHVDLEVMCSIKVDSSRVVEFQEWLGVMDTGEDVVLGYRITRRVGLLDLVTASVQEPAVLADVVGEENSDYPEMADDPEGWADQQLPHVPPGGKFDGIRKSVQEFSDVFGDLPAGGANVEPMPIDLKPGATLKPIPPRRLSPAMMQVVDNQVGEWLSSGVIRHSTSPHSAPLVIVRKKDGGYRVCVDYRELNAVTVDMKFPMMNAKALLERMAGKCVFGTLDLRTGFHQIPLTEEAKILTAFAHPKGLEEFNRLQFGLKNGPAYFQKTMARVLNGLAGSVCEVFVDDIIVHGGDVAEFDANLRAVLQRLREFGFRAKGEKCHLALPAVEYLGHRVNGEGIELTEERRQGIAAVKEPTTLTQLRSFLGMTNYFRPFIRNYALISKPLTRLCSKTVKFVWDDEAQHAFDVLKEAILDAPMLCHLNYEQPIIVRTDASTVGVGGVLLQRVDGREKCVCFVSKAFDGVQSRWATGEQEAYAVYYGIMKLHHHLLGHTFIVETDHRNLCFLQKATSPKVVRWRLSLQAFDFEVRHIAGKENVVADAMSRCLRLVDGHEDDIAKVHNAIVGHRGIQLTETLLRDTGKQWAGMRDDIAAYLRRCPTCQKTRLGLGEIEVAPATTEAHEPFEIVAVDTVGPLPVDSRGNKYIVVLIDCFTRFVELRATPGVGARDAAEVLLEVVGRYGAPRVLRSDNGPQYVARLVEELLALMQVRHNFTLPYRPQANGIVERVNGEVMRHLRALVMDKRVAEEWSVVLPLIQRIINATPHAAIGTSPATLMYAGAVHLDRGVLLPFRDDVQVVVTEQYLKDLLKAQQRLVETSQRAQQLTTEKKMKSPPVEPITYQVDDYVLASYPSKPPNKLAPRWRGPMRVSEVRGLHTYMCEDLRTQKSFPFHVTRLKKYDSSNTESELQVAEVDAGEWEVECIVDHRPARKRRDWQFRVRWSGYEPDEDSWLFYKDVKDLEALDIYMRGHPGLPF